jgi:hypothetical protein
MWRFFFAACFLTGAILIPHAGVGPVAAGILLAAVIQWSWSRSGRDSSR